MTRILVPIGGTRNDPFAVDDVIRRFTRDPSMEVHLLHVRTPLSADIAQLVTGRTRAQFHREQAEQALRPARERLDRFGVPHAVHIEVGDRARTIAAVICWLHCEQIVMATARKELADPAGRELGHRQAAAAHHGAGRDRGGQRDVRLGAFRHPAALGGRPGGCDGDRGLKELGHPIGPLGPRRRRWAPWVRDEPRPHRLHPRRRPAGAAASTGIVVIDGAMGTMIQRHKLTEADFRGERLPITRRT